MTGGGRGIGEGIARRLAEAGARVVLFDRDAEAAGAVAREIGGLAIVGDVCSESDAARAVAGASEAFGGPDIVVNNAGITGRADVSWNLTSEEFRAVLEVNVMGPFHLCKAALPGMLARGYGRILKHRLGRRQGGEPDARALLGVEGGGHRA